MSQVLLERLLHTLVVLQGPIRVDMCEISLVCLVAIAFSTLTRLFVDPLFGSSLGKEAGVTVEISHLRNLSPSVVPDPSHPAREKPKLQKLPPRVICRARFKLL